MDKTKTIPLDLAIEFNGVTYDSVTVREPTYGEVMEAARQSNGQGDAFLLSKTTGLPMQAVMKLPGSVAVEAIAFVTDFLKAPQ